MKTCKWSVRNVSHEAIEKLHNVQHTSGGLLGELVSEAINDWFDHLPEEPDIEEPIEPTNGANTRIHKVGQDTLRLKTDAESHSFGSDIS